MPFCVCGAHVTPATCRVFDLNPHAPQSCPHCGVFDGANGFREPRGVLREGADNPNARAVDTNHTGAIRWVPMEGGGES